MGYNSLSMVRNFQESRIARNVILTTETGYMIFSATAGIVLAQLAVTDIGRGDIPNVVFEAAGTILGAALTVFSGREVIATANNTSVNPQTNP